MLIKKIIVTSIFFIATNATAALENVIEALATLKQAPYGFCCVNMGITDADKADFNTLTITKTVWLDHCSIDPLSIDAIEQFLHTMGNNDTELVKRVAYRIVTIIDTIMKAS